MKRLFGVVIALALAYGALSLGDYLAMLVALGTPSKFLVGFVSIAPWMSATFGIVFWLFIAAEIVRGNEFPTNPRAARFVLWTALAATVFLEFALGMAFTPLARFGSYPWHWATWGDVLMVVAAVPVFATFSRWRRVKQRRRWRT